MKYELSIFADYFQFYLLDEGMDWSPENLWSKQALADMCALEPGFIAMSTVRNATVPVIIDVLDAAPDIDTSRFDHIVECSIEIASGRLVVIGCTDYLPDARRIPVIPGHYRVILSYEKLDTLRGNGLEGDDRYHAFIFPGMQVDLKVIKRFDGF